MQADHRDDTCLYTIDIEAPACELVSHPVHYLMRIMTNRTLSLYVALCLYGFVALRLCQSMLVSL